MSKRDSRETWIVCLVPLLVTVTSHYASGEELRSTRARGNGSGRSQGSQLPGGPRISPSVRGAKAGAAIPTTGPYSRGSVPSPEAIVEQLERLAVEAYEPTLNDELQLLALEGPEAGAKLDKTLDSSRAVIPTRQLWVHCLKEGPFLAMLFLHEEAALPLRIEQLRRCSRAFGELLSRDDVVRELVAWGDETVNHWPQDDRHAFLKMAIWCKVLDSRSIRSKRTSCARDILRVLCSMQARHIEPAMKKPAVAFPSIAEGSCARLAFSIWNDLDPEAAAAWKQEHARFSPQRSDRPTSVLGEGAYADLYRRLTRAYLAHEPRPESPVSAVPASAPVASSPLQALHAKANETIAGMHPERTREEVTVALAEVIQEGDRVATTFSGAPGAMEARAVGTEFERLMQQALSAPEHVNWGALWAQHYISAKEYGRVHACVRAAFTSGKSLETVADGRFAVALLNLLQKKSKEAVDEFDSLAKAFPRSPWAARSWQWIGDIHLAEQRYAEAIESYTRLVQQYPDFRGIEEVKETIKKLSASTYVQRTIGSRPAK